MAEQVTADKANVAENATKVAEDRAAAEIAAQTAQTVADSLPDDYVTAVAKIAENTADIASIKLTDKEMKRRVDALYDMGQGVTHQFETDTETAYAKTVPTGAKLMSVKNIGGRSIVFNQMIPDSIIHVTITVDEDVADEKWLKQIIADTSPIAQAIGHKVVGKCIRDINNPSSYVTVRFGNNNVNVSNGSERYTTTENGIYTLSSGVGNPPPLYFRAFAGATAGTYKFTLQLFDLTAMFGTGNEPSTVEEFEKMFPADYYPYCAGEVVSAGTEEVVEQGKNLLNADDYYAAYKQPDGSYVNNSSDFANIDIPIGNYIGKTLVATLKATVSAQPTSFFWLARIDGNRVESLYAKGERVLANTTGIARLTVTPKTQNDTLAMSFGQGSGDVIVRDIQVELGDTPTAYAPYHRTTYPIPEAIKALPGYGVEGNVTDYEAKTYTQNNTVDGTGIKALDTPIITDISSLIPDDFLRNIEVEAGGSVTFKNSNDSYRIPVPSEEEYIVKMSEVGGSV